MANDAKIAAFNGRCAISGVAKIEFGNGGLPRIQIETAAATAEIYLHGAQVTGWKPAGADEVLFVSEKSHWEAGRAIRGGIPVCFPWFRGKSDNPKAPAHGFVRTKEWHLESITEVSGESVCVYFSTGSDEATRKWWPFDFRLEYRITVGARLKAELRMKNTGVAALRFEEALHTYFNVGDVEKAEVRGLDGVAYFDNRDGNRRKIQTGALRLSAQTDNAFVGASGSVEIVDGVLGRRLKTAKRNSNSTIVWNPWSDGASSLTDFGADEWRRMLCVEGGNILDSAVSLQPEESHTMNIEISVATETVHSCESFRDAI
ncbi:MAG: D-hexose-6-phosphate mutarotase [Terracidiphilus sp.]